MRLKGDSKFSKKSLQFTESEGRCKQILKTNFVEEELVNSARVDREYRTESTAKDSSRHLCKKFTLQEQNIVSEVFRKNLSKLKNHVQKLGDKAIEENVLTEILDHKHDMIIRIKTAINKMSKKVLK